MSNETARFVWPERGASSWPTEEIVLMARQGKTNKHGKIQYSVVVRNVDVETCPVGALAFYLLEYLS
ncbi:hypothetical protein DFQ27_005025, partial [Actinomortierella ambigua]